MQYNYETLKVIGELEKPTLLDILWYTTWKCILLSFYYPNLNNFYDMYLDDLDKSTVLVCKTHLGAS